MNQKTINILLNILVFLGKCLLLGLSIPVVLIAAAFGLSKPYR